ncbi:DUF262 domain-containing protein [Segatella bryantii]|uniref:DUF262 domain-containing protein n=1 Tax=Segatella bryantii TaxID=77095 RepID=UPI0008871ED5|nr:DUF262 domain-containing protein [Segatella bryantii]SDL58142.1 Protein of unknown function [Segatella bryantii]
MAENKIELKSVSELLGMKFFIPSYQRGYRWTDLQIENLLNDILEFSKGIDGDFYCLQPLVVKKRKKDLLAEIKQANSIEDVETLLKGEWIVIDGQQRLTTIYLILKALENEYCPSLEYERESYIEVCDSCDEIKKDNIEIYHLTSAKKCIRKWIETNSKDSANTLRNKILEQAKFIFYNVGDVSEEQEHDIFNNLNSGRIALTNAELIKALFLNKVGKEDIAHREVEQRLLADEFDQIERTLRQDDFWYFLAGNTEKPSSCINLLFDLMLESSEQNGKYHTDEPFRTFFYFNDLINGNESEDSYKKSKKIWEDVRKVFHITEGWFNDSVMYNLIGYHRAANGGKTLCEIYKKFREKKSKKEFKKWLVDECKNHIDYPDGFMQLRYDENKDKVFNLLLLFNIATLNERPQEAVKFSFANLHKYNWDVEHISPQNPKNDEDLKKAVEKFKDNEHLNNLIDALNKEEKDTNIIEEERSKFFVAGDDLMGIQNLTLLTEHDNRGIGNKFFFEKRQTLQKFYQQGSFIPACSMNVFMKFYSDNPEQMAFWDEKDRESYKNKLEQTIKKIFNNEQ